MIAFPVQLANHGLVFAQSLLLGQFLVIEEQQDQEVNALVVQVLWIELVSLFVFDFIIIIII